MTELWPFVGRFHPLLVHFPIGILLLAALLEALAWRRARRRDPPAVDEAMASPTGGSRAVTLMLALGAGAAAASATTGYLLGTSGGYASDTFTRHQAAGFIVAIAACAAAAASLARDRWSSALWRRLYVVSLSVTVVALVLAGHLGATLTHGEGYLTEHAPGPLRALLARVGLGGPAVAAAPALDQALVYGSLVEPVLRARCVACHGAAKAEGELRLDSSDGLRKGGQSGPLFTPGRADRSEIVRRLWLPASDPDVMPPAGQRPLSPVEASVVRWWIDRGASFDQKVMDAELTPEVRPAIEAVFGPIERGGPTLPRVTLGAPDRSALAALTASSVSVVPVAAGTPFLHVHATNARLTFDDAAVKRLEPIAAHVLWLDLSDTRITDAGMATIARLPNLTRLHLARTAITDAGLAPLARLERLEYLNLYGTAVTDAGLASLVGLKNLRTLYVWKTAITPAGVEKLKASLPRLQVELGPQTPPQAVATPPTPPTH